MRRSDHDEQITVGVRSAHLEALCQIFATAFLIVKIGVALVIAMPVLVGLMSLIGLCLALRASRRRRQESGHAGRRPRRRRRSDRTDRPETSRLRLRAAAAP